MGNSIRHKWVKLANSAEPGEMTPYVAFHLGLHCLPKYMFTGIQNDKGFNKDSLDLRYSNTKRKYGKCSKISNTSFLPKWPRHTCTVQTQIRLLLKKQSDQCLSCLLF